MIDRTVEILTDDLEVGQQVAADLKCAGFDSVQVSSPIPEGCVACRVITDRAARKAGVGQRLTEVVRSTFARRFFDVNAQVEDRRASPEDGPVLRVELPMKLARSRFMQNKTLATAHTYRLTVWGEESLAYSTLRPLRRLCPDYELGPSTWEGERRVILYGGAPEALIDEIVRVVHETVAVDLRKRNCWSLDNLEIRIRLPDMFLPVETRRELSTMKYARWACGLSEDQLSAVFWAAGELGAGIDDMSGVPFSYLVHAETRPNIGLAAIRRAVTGRPLTQRALLDAIRGRTLDSLAGDAPPAQTAAESVNEQDLMSGRWAQRLSRDEMVALLWAVGEVIVRVGGDDPLDAGHVHGDRVRIRIALGALRAAIGSHPLSVEQLDASLRAGQLATSR
jgi:hypothetical protein